MQGFQGCRRPARPGSPAPGLQGPILPRCPGGPCRPPSRRLSAARAGRREEAAETARRGPGHRGRRPGDRGRGARPGAVHAAPGAYALEILGAKLSAAGARLNFSHEQAVKIARDGTASSLQTGFRTNCPTMTNRTVSPPQARSALAEQNGARRENEGLSGCRCISLETGFNPLKNRPGSDWGKALCDSPQRHLFINVTRRCLTCQPAPKPDRTS